MATAGSKGKGGPTGGARPRPAAGTARPPLPKVLRIGIIQEGKIIEERIIRRRDTVTIGPSEKNDFVLISKEIPSARFEMFELTKSGQYVLNFTDRMTGRISAKGEILELDQARTSGRAKRKGKAIQLPLNDESRGKVVVGESTVLFQFVAPPPIQPRPQLPTAVRGGVFKSIEWFITTAWVISFLLHAGIIVYWETTDWPVISKWDKYLELEELVTPANDATFEKEKAQVDEGEGEAEEVEDEGEAEEEPEQKTARKAGTVEEGPKKSAAEIARERAAKKAALADAIAERGINKILGSLGGGGEGAIADVLRGGDVGADQDELLGQVSGVGVATGEEGALRGPAGGKGTGEAADISQIKMEGGSAGSVKTAGAGTEKKVKGKGKAGKAKAVGGTGMADSAEIGKIIGRKQGAIRSCYERALRRNPTLKGRVMVRFTISGSGKVTTARPTKSELPPEVGDCIANTIKRFRFPPPEGGSATMEIPFMFMPAG